MNIRERLNRELGLCRRSREQAGDRAVEAGRAYIARRLAQLDNRFPRHAFGWQEPTIWMCGLQVVPAVWGEHTVERMAVLALRTLPDSRTIPRLVAVSRDLDAVSAMVGREFGRLPAILSPRAIEWGVTLDRLPRDPVVVRQNYGIGRGRLADAAGPRRIWPMHRRGGCGFF